MQNNSPQHVAIIMDGNRRWANTQGVSYEDSYNLAVKSVKDAVSVAIDRSVAYLTLFAFSVENNNRSEKEISIIKRVLNRYLKEEYNTILEQDIKVIVIGDYKNFDTKVANTLDSLQIDSQNNSSLTLVIALNYSGRQEIIMASQALANLNIPITEENLRTALYTSNIPDPDIIIRTGGHSRLSNFMLWQVAYTEMYFLKKYWPEFSKEDFNNVLDQFKLVERKYGK